MMIIKILVYDLKFVGALKIEFIAPIPEQTGTPTMHFSNVSGGHIKSCQLKSWAKLVIFEFLNIAFKPTEALDAILKNVNLVHFTQIFGWQLLICAS